MATAWRRHDDDMPMAWWQHRDGIAMTWRRHGDHMATAWRRHCDDMATTRRPHGDDMATTWRRHGDDMATTWRRHGDDMATWPGRQRRRWERRWRRWRGRRRRSCTRQSYIGYGVDIDIHMAMVWWCRSAFVTTKSVFRMFFPRWAPCFLNRARLNGCVSCAGSIQLELCSINVFETTAVFFWQPMSSHVAKVTTWTNLVNLNSGFFDVSVHKYIPRQEGWIRRTMQGTNGLFSFWSPALSGDELLLSGARGAEKVFPFYVVSETPSYMSRLCRKPLRGVPPQSHCTSGFSVPIGI